MTKCQLIIIGAGPAGLASAVEAYRSGVRDILIIERDVELGGILNQCVHTGFGLDRFGEELCGPEYAHRFIKMLGETNARVKLGTLAVDIERSGDRKIVSVVSEADGFEQIEAQSVILAMGCRERNRGPLFVPGGRGRGVFTAGSAQRYLNLEGYLIGKRVIILGSGDIGLIMARRLTLEGATVLGVVEILPFANGLTRNVTQCLEDFDIPLYLSHTVTNVIGKTRLEGIVISEVDENLKPIAGTEKLFDCDTLLLSVGLVPENEITRDAGIELDARTGGAKVNSRMETSVPGVFACGNVLHIHDLVDSVTEEAERAGRSAAEYISGAHCPENDIRSIFTGINVTYTVPQRFSPSCIEGKLDLLFRVRKRMNYAVIRVEADGKPVAEFRRRYLMPGEMEKITVPAALLAESTGDLTVSAVEAEEEA